jgi:uncharacterized protein (TIGR03435 family)
MKVFAGAIALIFAAGACAQSDAALTFEVATVKPSPPVGNGPMMMGGRGGPGTPDPGRFATFNLPLKLLLSRAYGVKDFQVTGPGWLESERYDITAKVPPGTTKEQFNVMLQNLLIERFKIELHRDQKEVPIYTLTVGKNGSKLKETTLPPSAFEPPAPGATLPPPPPPRPGEPARMPTDRPGLRMMFNGSKMQLTAVGQTAAQFIDLLSRQVGRPIVDKTGLAGKYDFDLEFAPETGAGAARMLPVAPPGGGPGGDGGGPASDPLPSLVTAVQQLGLRLEAGKGPVEMIVIDKAEKTPIEN